MISSVLVSQAPAEATTETTVSHTFIRSKEWYSKPLHRCFNITMIGTVKATYGANRRGRWLKNPRISDTTMTVRVRKNCSADTKATVRKLELRQYYYDRACKVKPSLSAGASTSGALSIGVSATNVCNDFQTGYRSSTYGKKNHFKQSASGSEVKWGKSVSWVQSGPTSSYHEVCVTGEFELQPYVGTNRDDLLKFTFGDICQWNPQS